MTDCTMDELNTLSESAEFKEYVNKRYDFEEALMSESVMWRFWKSYLDMSELFLCIIYATRSGDWELYVESIRSILLWVFTYDRQNYVRYLTLHFMDLLNLEENYPSVHCEFIKGSFAVQMSSDNPFGKMEADKVIETTMSRDTKTPGGTTGNNIYHMMSYTL